MEALLGLERLFTVGLLLTKRQTEDGRTLRHTYSSDRGDTDTSVIAGRKSWVHVPTPRPHLPLPQSVARAGEVSRLTHAQLSWGHSRVTGANVRPPANPLTNRPGCVLGAAHSQRPLHYPRTRWWGAPIRRTRTRAGARSSRTGVEGSEEHVDGPTTMIAAARRWPSGDEWGAR